MVREPVRAGTEVRVAARAYSLLLRPDRPSARLEDATGHAWAELFLPWAADTAAGADSTSALGEPVRDELAGAVRISIPMSSHVWRSKTLILDCRQDEIEARLTVTGEGDLTDLHLFAGHFTGALRYGTGYFRSGAGFDRVFNPEPSRAELRTRPAWSSTAIDVMGTSVPGSEHWFATPAPFCYAVARSDHGPWLTMGLAVEPQQNTFTAFHYDGLDDSFGFRLAYEGQTRVNGEWTSPGLVLRPGAPDPYSGLELYALGLEKAGMVRCGRSDEGPLWWARPIFCGWGAQSHMAASIGTSAQEQSTQANYDRFLEALASNGLEPGTVVIDDKWQRTYGRGEVDPAKWPDLKGWIAKRHARGQRVLLWWKAWDPEGLESGHCVTDAAGRPVAADPSNRDYEALLRAWVRNALGRDGLDADGFKVDFTARTPSGPGLRRQGREWGVELLHRLLAILYEEAKATKPDALVMTHTPNPYFRDVTDMLRLNDVNLERPVVEQMRHRARIAELACPDALIDTDNWPMPNREAWRDYLAVQAELGVPSLYYATHVDTSGEELAAEDYAAVAAAWAGCRS